MRLLQQPEQRCTSTHGGHTRKLALVRSMRRREISNTSVRVLHSAIMAGSATVGEPEGRGDLRQEGGPAQSPHQARSSRAARALLSPTTGRPSPASFHPQGRGKRGGGGASARVLVVISCGTRTGRLPMCPEPQFLHETPKNRCKDPVRSLRRLVCRKCQFPSTCPQVHLRFHTLLGSPDPWLLLAYYFVNTLKCCRFTMLPILTSLLLSKDCFLINGLGANSAYTLHLQI